MSTVAAADTTLTQLWRRSVDDGPDRPFLTFEAADATVRHWSYGEFDGAVAELAESFRACGADTRRGVHLALTNTPSFVAAWLAALRIGSFVVPSDPLATMPELAEHVERTRPVVGLCAATRADVYRAMADAQADPSLVVIEVDEAHPEVVSFDVADAPDTPAASGSPPGPDARAAVLFTSGTTGRPKGVVITQANYAFAGTTMATAAGLGPDDRQLVVLPLFHANAQYYSFAPAIAVGASVALMHTFSASRFVEQAARHAATHASLFAGPIRMILARGGPLAAGADGLRLRHCWFAQNLAAEQYETISSWLGCRPRQLYGMTETIPAVLTDSVDDPRSDTMGYVTAGCTVEIHDADGRRCGPGQVGEIVVGGRPGREVFAGYLDDTATTEASFRDGWFLTGDRAVCDESGRHRFEGRRADVLKVAGENVSVVEVEAVLGDHALVHEVVVVGAPDPVRDEVPVAFVVRAAHHDDVSDAELTDRLDAWATERLAKAKRPVRYVVVDDLPRTSVGKIRKFLLTQAALDADTRVAGGAIPQEVP